MFVHYQSVYFAVERQHRRIKEMVQGELYDEVGICYNLANLNYSFDADKLYSSKKDYAATEALRLSTFRTWNCFSGIVSYPIPSHNESSAMEAYITAYNMGTLWDRSTAYGAMRYELLRHMEQRYALFLNNGSRPQRSAMARFLKDDGFGQLI